MRYCKNTTVRARTAMSLCVSSMRRYTIPSHKRKRIPRPSFGRTLFGRDFFSLQVGNGRYEVVRTDLVR